MKQDVIFVLPDTIHDTDYYPQHTIQTNIKGESRKFSDRSPDLLPPRPNVFIYLFIYFYLYYNFEFLITLTSCSITGILIQSVDLDLLGIICMINAHMC